MTRMTLTMSTAAFLMGTAAIAADADMSAIDTNGNGVADYGEFVALYPQMTPELFARFDANADGVVEQAEFFTEETQMTLERFGRGTGEIAVTADLDGDGNITLDELSEIAPGISAETYSSMDLNGDGTLDLIEYNTAEAQAILNDWENQVVFVRVQDYDTDGDGALSLDELRVAVPGIDPEDLEMIEGVESGTGDGRAIYRPVAKITQ